MAPRSIPPALDDLLLTRDRAEVALKITVYALKRRIAQVNDTHHPSPYLLSKTYLLSKVDLATKKVILSRDAVLEAHVQLKHSIPGFEGEIFGYPELSIVQMDAWDRGGIK